MSTHVNTHKVHVKKTLKPFLRHEKILAAEMAQRLRVLAALPEVLSSIPSTHMVPHSCLELQFQGI